MYYYLMNTDYFLAILEIIKGTFVTNFKLRFYNNRT